MGNVIKLRILCSLFWKSDREFVP